METFGLTKTSSDEEIKTYIDSMLNCDEKYAHFIKHMGTYKQLSLYDSKTKNQYGTGAYLIQRLFDTLRRYSANMDIFAEHGVAREFRFTLESLELYKLDTCKIRNFEIDFENVRTFE